MPGTSWPGLSFPRTPQHGRTGVLVLLGKGILAMGDPRGAGGLTLPHFHDDFHGARLADPSFPVLQPIQRPVGSGCKKREGALGGFLGRLVPRFPHLPKAFAAVRT